MNWANERIVVAEEESIGDLLKDLRDEVLVLFRQQVELAKTETSEKVSIVSRNAIYLFAGGLVAFAGALFLLAGLTFLGYVGLVSAGVAPAVAMWLMPLIAGIIVGAVGVFLVVKALQTFKHTNVMPEKTFDSIKEDRQWLTKKGK